MALSGTTLVTGGSGFIGAALSQALRFSGSAVLAPDHRTLDVTDRAAVAAFLEEHRVQNIMHFASRGVIADPSDTSLIDEERAMVQALCDGLNGGGTFFYAGSMSEYGQSGHLSETAACTPQNAYARAKLEAGLWLRRHAPERGITPVVGRIFGAYGPGEAPSRLFPQVIAALKSGSPVDLSDGSQLRDFVHVTDVARASIGLMMLKNPPDCVNLGTGIGVSVRYAIKRLGQELGYPLDYLRFGARARSAHDLDVLVACPQRLRDALGWTLPQRLQDGVPILSLMMPDMLTHQDSPPTRDQQACKHD